MEIGIVSRISEFPKEFWREEFKTFSGKVDYMEIISNCPHFPAHNIETNSQKTLMLKNLSQKYKIPIKAIHHLPNQCLGAILTGGVENFFEQEKRLQKEYFNLSSLDEKVRRKSIKQIEDILPVSRFLGADFIVAHGGSYERGEDYPNHLEKLRKSLAEIDYYTEKNFMDKKFCIENLPSVGHFGNEVKELPKKPEEMIDCVSGLKNIGIWFDIGHANSIYNPLFFYDSISKTNKIYGMHIHDNSGNKDDHLPLGMGNIDFKRFIQKLKADNYKGHLSIELDTWPEPPRGMEKHERIAALDYLNSLKQ